MPLRVRLSDWLGIRSMLFTVPPISKNDFPKSPHRTRFPIGKVPVVGHCAINHLCSLHINWK